MSRTRLYKITTIACLAGYSWLALLLINPDPSGHGPGVCLIKTVTDIPCPSCGSSRSIMALVNGDFLLALHWNPIGFILLGMMIISPWWILHDVVHRKDSFLRFYSIFENRLRKKWIAIPLLTLVVSNWIWNIIKGL